MGVYREGGVALSCVLKLVNMMKKKICVRVLMYIKPLRTDTTSDGVLH